MVLLRFDPRNFLGRVGDGKSVRDYRPSEVIFRQRAAAEHVFYLQSGRAKETVTSEQGREAIIGVLEAGLFFGTNAVDAGASRLSTVIAVTHCVVTAITREAMNKALEDPRFAQLFVAYLLYHNSKIEAEKIDLLFNSSEKRLAQRLLILSRVSEGAPQRIGPEITQEMLADMIGTTRPRVNYFLNKFRKQGFIRYNGGIEVLPALLRAVLQESPITGIKRE